MLLEVDGISGDWDGANGLFDFDSESENSPFVLKRLATSGEQRNYDNSGMVPGMPNESSLNDELLYFSDDIDTPVPEVVPTKINDVKYLSCDIFQKNLLSTLISYSNSKKYNGQEEKGQI